MPSRKSSAAALPSTSKGPKAPTEKPAAAKITDQEAPGALATAPEGPPPEPAAEAEIARALPRVREPVLVRPEPDDGSWHVSKYKQREMAAALKVPLAITGDEMPLRKDLDIRNLTPKQSLGLFALERGFLTSGVTTDDGCEVNSRQQAVRKVLEIAAESMVE